MLNMSDENKEAGDIQITGGHALVSAPLQHTVLICNFNDFNP